MYYRYCWARFQLWRARTFQALFFRSRGAAPLFNDGFHGKSQLVDGRGSWMSGRQHRGRPGPTIWVLSIVYQVVRFFAETLANRAGLVAVPTAQLFQFALLGSSQCFVFLDLWRHQLVDEIDVVVQTLLLIRVTAKFFILFYDWFFLYYFERFGSFLLPGSK